jgi:MoaA/NifB/PqqE/SkfB family radical SAM enzyme
MNDLTKLFANKDFVLKLHRVGKIFPLHVTVCLNNADRSQELSLRDIKRLGTTLFKLKCQAVTLMGGDPLQHLYINEIIKVLNYNAVRVGIVTSGGNLHFLMDHIPVYWIQVTGKPEKEYLAEQKHRPICRQWLRPDAPKSDFTAGVKHCWVSLLKPVIVADGYVYPCINMNKESMGNDLLKIYTNQKPFDGSSCEHCYNSELNKMLDSFVHKPERMEWI